MASKNKNIIKSESTTSRAFDYSYGNVTLKFSLRTDIKTDMKDFLVLLEKAVSDVKEELNG